MKLRTALTSAAALALAATGTLAGIAATTASANPPPPPVVIHTTSVETSAIHLGPVVSVLRFNEYQPKATAPGFAETATILEVCDNVPHVNPPTPLTVLAVCNWRLTATGPAPHNTLSGNAVVNGEGQIGRVTGGTHAWAGAHSAPLPIGFLSLNEAPRVAADTFTFNL